MADRHGASSRPAGGGGGISKARSGSAAAAEARGGVTGSSVRRNLFQSQLTRRPTAGSSSTSGAPETTTTTLRLDADAHSDSSSDIVIRDKNGEVELGDPPTPPIDEPDEVALDARHENERERERLAEAVKQHQIDQNSMPVQPDELLEAVRASLRAKVAALAEDNWMFEPEELPRHQ
ncbi:hypothetical protein B0T22DRAFT_235764 [Podospora appendiculata]|uniref:Uncharacterized protein n=1 Tax=Podospora appendiculata TaxID=314037 RepID=A0AAE1CAX0_9PEZI|nr:hypothetical protein B0T22DRAFT_235764 [Podospora appendiculata]